MRLPTCFTRFSMIALYSTTSMAAAFVALLVCCCAEASYEQGSYWNDADYKTRLSGQKLPSSIDPGSSNPFETSNSFLQSNCTSSAPACWDLDSDGDQDCIFGCKDGIMYFLNNGTNKTANFVRITGHGGKPSRHLTSII